MADPCPECGGELRGRHRHPCCLETLEGCCPECFGDAMNGCTACLGTGRAPDGRRDALDVILNEMVAVAELDRAPTLEKA